MRVGVVSDTHMYGRSRELPSALTEGLQGVDLILHAGDWMDEHIPDLFERIAPVDGVAGNNDGIELVQRFGRSKILQLSGYRIGIVHGDGGRKTTMDRAMDEFSDTKVDCIIFGHSHIPYQAVHQGILLLNPGSPTDKRRQPRFSFAILSLEEAIDAEHFYYDK
ncbi:metallophosphoesterase family protein [Paenibacillus agricola]|uniref:Phosphoesterase n=1 Tax=Paenibacillus agricola TaxID=2716264 RepID=A0ABX0J2X3_9BACL|nr:metallophosphoesterase family protein [Paenibacillus agricola]NHN30680.1 metallophosphoesterase family protein [Paenibacillus agricola]